MSSAMVSRSKELNRRRRLYAWLNDCSKKSLCFYLIALLIAIGGWDYALREKENSCEMTYMFQYPEFIPIVLKSEVRDRFPSYKLFAYGEGAYAQQLRDGKFEGSPVLFIPGNAGSYKQVRSLASVAQRMHAEHIRKVQFNYFAVDFDDELSGIYGGVLNDQVNFIYEAIEHLSRLYVASSHGHVVPPTFIIIGHSIGGVVARALLTLPKFDPSRVDLLVTLAAPHRAPVLSLDLAISKFYGSINDFWTKSRNLSALSGVTQLSISGGHNDIIVHSDLAQIPAFKATGDLFAVSTSIPDVWLSMDHLCIVWCRQFVVKINRLLFDIVGDVVNQHKVSMTSRRDVIDYHFNRNTRGKNYPAYVVPKNIVFPAAVGLWTEFVRRCQRLAKPKVLEAQFLLVRLVPQTTIVVTMDGEVKLDWIVACNVTGTIRRNNQNLKYCESGYNLSPLVTMFPGSMSAAVRNGQALAQTKKVLKHSADSLLAAGYSHVNIWLAPNSGAISLVTERYPSGKRNKAIVLPSILQSLTMAFSYATVLTVPVTEESTYYNLSMVGLSQVWHAYSLRLEVTSCYTTASAKASGLMHFFVPWSKEDVYTKIPSMKGATVETVLELGVPKLDPDDERDPGVHLLIDPDCGYKLELRISFLAVLSQFMRYYYPLIIPYIGAVLLVTLASQITLQERPQVDLNRTKSSNNSSKRPTNDDVDEGRPGSSKGNFISPKTTDLLRNNFLGHSLYGLIPLAPFLAIKMLSSEALRDNEIVKQVLTADMANLTTTQFIALHCILYTAAYAICYVFAAIIGIVLDAICWVLSLTFKESQTQLVQEPIFTPLVASLAILVTCLGASSGVAMILALVVQVIVLILFEGRCAAEGLRKGLTRSSTAARSHFTISLLILMATGPTVPLAIYWFKSSQPLFHFVRSLLDASSSKRDPLMVPVTILVLPLSYIFRRRPLTFLPLDSRGIFSKRTLRTSAIVIAVAGHNYYLITWVIVATLVLVLAANLLSAFYHDDKRIKKE